MNDQPASWGCGPGQQRLTAISPVNCRAETSSHTAKDIPPVAEAEDPRKTMRPICAVSPRNTRRRPISPTQPSADSNVPELPRCGAPRHVNDRAASGDTERGNNGLGHQLRELPRPSCRARDWRVPPVAAGEDVNKGHAAHSLGAAAEHSSTIDTADATVADNNLPELRGAASEHVNDQPHLGDTERGNNGLGHQLRELPSQAAAHATRTRPPVAAGEDVNEGHAAHSHGAAANGRRRSIPPARRSRIPTHRAPKVRRPGR